MTKKNLHKITMQKKRIEELQGAEYNPRKISDAAMSALKSSIDRFGLVQPIVWNQQTGNVVGGHQRLDAMRQLGVEEIDVAVVNLSPNDEKALNLTLNNQAVQGEWDSSKLEIMLSELTSAPDYDELIATDIGLDLLVDQFAIERLDIESLFARPQSSPASEDDNDDDIDKPLGVQPAIIKIETAKENVKTIKKHLISWAAEAGLPIELK